MSIKPSERIERIAKEICETRLEYRCLNKVSDVKDDLYNALHNIMARSEAVAKYLDEQWQKEQNNDSK